MSSSILRSILVTSTLLTTVLAVPNVTVVPATGGCSAYPAYDESTGIAGPWTIQVNQCDNSTIEGYGDNCQLFRRSGEDGITMGSISIASVNDQAKIPLQCNDNPAPGTLEARVPTGVSGYAWNQVNITEYPYDAELMWGLGQYGTPIEAYYHYVDGVQQPGLFLGQGNVTTWGIKWYPVDGSNTWDGEPYWLFRLLGPDSEIDGAQLQADEYTTFIIISGSD